MTQTNHSTLLEKLIEEGEIDEPTITKEEIKDRSKGDVLMKGLVLIQMMWFLLQCIACAGKNLTLTELELVTAALAILNVITYVLWWAEHRIHCCSTVMMGLLTLTIFAGPSTVSSQLRP